MSRVPDALIRRLCYPSSYRLPRVKRLLYPPAVDAPLIRDVFPIAVSRGGVTTFYPERALVPTVELGNLSNEDYRHFVGRLHKDNTYGQCRWCDAHLANDDLRKKHLLACDCKGSLSELYRLIRVAPKQRSCMVCDVDSVSLMWGIPLCSTKCQNVWRFSLPDAFLFARMMLKKGKADA